MEVESVVTRSVIDELHFSDIKGDETEGERCMTRSIIGELILGIFNEIKWKVKVVLFEVSFMN